MTNKEINMLWLYPDLLNLHGDRGNVMAFERVGELLGVKVNVHKVENITESFELDDIDLILLNPGELGTILNIAKGLNPKRDELIKYVRDGKYLIAIGTTGALLGKRIYNTEKQQFYGLGIIDMECSQRKTVIGDDLHFIIDNEQELIGSQIQMLDFTVALEDSLGTALYGYGNAGDKTEGARNKNAIFTNALGPVFVKNPWWAEEILSDIAKRKGIETKVISLDSFEVEIKSFNTTKKFIENKKNKKKK